MEIFLKYLNNMPLLEDRIFDSPVKQNILQTDNHGKVELDTIGNDNYSVVTA